MKKNILVIITFLLLVAFTTFFASSIGWYQINTNNGNVTASKGNTDFTATKFYEGYYLGYATSTSTLGGREAGVSDPQNVQFYNNRIDVTGGLNIALYEGDTLMIKHCTSSASLGNTVTTFAPFTQYSDYVEVDTDNNNAIADGTITIKRSGWYTFTESNGTIYIDSITYKVKLTGITDTIKSKLNIYKDDTAITSAESETYVNVPALTEENKLRIYFVMNSSARNTWGINDNTITVRAFYWGGSQANCAAFPGELCTKVDDLKYYIEVPNDISGIVFATSDYDLEHGDSRKTADIYNFNTYNTFTLTGTENSGDSWAVEGSNPDGVSGTGGNVTVDNSLSKYFNITAKDNTTTKFRGFAITSALGVYPVDYLYDAMRYSLAYNGVIQATPSYASKDDIYLVGSINGCNAWDVAIDNNKLVQVDGVYTISKQLVAGSVVRLRSFIDHEGGQSDLPSNWQDQGLSRWLSSSWESYHWYFMNFLQTGDDHPAYANHSNAVGLYENLIIQQSGNYLFEIDTTHKSVNVTYFGEPVYLGVVATPYEDQGVAKYHFGTESDEDFYDSYLDFPDFIGSDLASSYFSAIKHGESGYYNSGKLYLYAYQGRDTLSLVPRGASETEYVFAGWYTSADNGTLKDLTSDELNTIYQSQVSYINNDPVTNDISFVYPSYHKSGAYLVGKVFDDNSFNWGNDLYKMLDSGDNAVDLNDDSYTFTKSDTSGGGNDQYVYLQAGNELKARNYNYAAEIDSAYNKGWYNVAGSFDSGSITVADKTYGTDAYGNYRNDDGNYVVVNSGWYHVILSTGKNPTISFVRAYNVRVQDALKFYSGSGESATLNPEIVSEDFWLTSLEGLGDGRQTSVINRFDGWYTAVSNSNEDSTQWYDVWDENNKVVSLSNISSAEDNTSEHRVTLYSRYIVRYFYIYDATTSSAATKVALAVEDTDNLTAAEYSVYYQVKFTMTSELDNLLSNSKKYVILSSTTELDDSTINLSSLPDGVTRMYYNGSGNPNNLSFTGADYNGGSPNTPWSFKIQNDPLSHIEVYYKVNRSNNNDYTIWITDYFRVEVKPYDGTNGTSYIQYVENGSRYDEDDASSHVLYNDSTHEYSFDGAYYTRLTWPSDYDQTYYSEHNNTWPTNDSHREILGASFTRGDLQGNKYVLAIYLNENEEFRIKRQNGYVSMYVKYDGNTSYSSSGTVFRPHVSQMYYVYINNNEEAFIEAPEVYDVYFSTGSFSSLWEANNNKIAAVAFNGVEAGTSNEYYFYLPIDKDDTSGIYHFAIKNNYKYVMFIAVSSSSTLVHGKNYSWSSINALYQTSDPMHRISINSDINGQTYILNQVELAQNEDSVYRYRVIGNFISWDYTEGISMYDDDDNQRSVTIYLKSGQQFLLENSSGNYLYYENRNTSSNEHVVQGDSTPSGNHNFKVNYDGFYTIYYQNNTAKVYIALNNRYHLVGSYNNSTYVTGIQPHYNYDSQTQQKQWIYVAYATAGQTFKFFDAGSGWYSNIENNSTSNISINSNDNYNYVAGATGYYIFYMKPECGYNANNSVYIGYYSTLSAMINADNKVSSVHFYASSWTANVTITVTPATGSSSTYYQLSGSSYTLGSLPSNPNGYVYEWNTKSDGTGTPYNAGATISNITSNMSFYQYARPNTYSITLDSNDGTDNGSATATFNSSTLSITDATKTGYHLDGYYDAATNGNKVINADGSLVSSYANYINDGTWVRDNNGYYSNDGETWNTLSTSGITLYAHWVANTYKLTLHNYGTSEAVKTITVTYDSSELIIPDDFEDFTRSNLHLDSYNLTQYANSGTNKQIICFNNSEHILAPSVSGYTNADGEWIHDGDVDLYAIWYYDAPSLTPGNYSGTYDGESHQVSVAISHPLYNNGLTANYQWKLNGSSLGSGSTYSVTNAQTNTYQVLVTLVGADDIIQTVKGADVKATIARASISPSVSIDNWAYNSAASAATTTGNPGSGAVTYYYKVKGANDDTYTVYDPASTYPTAVGNYTIKAVVAETTNYNTGYVEKDFEIIKANISPSVSISGWTYGDNASTPSVSGNSGEAGVTYEYKLTSAADSAYSTNVPTNAGNYIIRATIAASTSYNGGSATNTFTIARADINPTVTLSGWTYGGDATTPAINNGGNPGNGSITYSYKVSGADDNSYVTYNLSTGNVPTSAGNYVIKAVIAQTDNYNGKTITNTFAISQKTLTVTWSGTRSASEMYYTGGAIAPTPSLDSSEFITGDNVTISVTSGKQTNVGTGYTATASLSGTGYQNYSMNSSTQSYSIGYKVQYAAGTPAGGNIVNPDYVSSTGTGNYTSKAGSVYTDPSGYDFDNWSNSNGGTVNGSASMTVSGNVTLTATWKVENYTVTVVPIDGTGSATISIDYLDTSVNSIDSNTLAKSGYTVVGYAVRSGSAGNYTYTKVIEANGNVVSGNVIGYVTGGQWTHTTNNITLYAMWLQCYTVTFMSPDNSTEYATAYAAQGGSGTINNTDASMWPNDPTTAADAQYTYTFKRWSTTADADFDNNAFTADTVVTQNTTVYVKWTETTNTYTISDATLGTDVASVTWYADDSGTAISWPVAYGTTVYYKLTANNNYHIDVNLQTTQSTYTAFVIDSNNSAITEWTSMQVGGLINVNISGTSGTADTYNITLTNTNATTDGSTSATSTYLSSSLTEITNPQRTGYTFAGWYTASSGGYKVIDTDGSFADYTSNISSYINSDCNWINTANNVTLYAQWSVITYNVSYSLNSGAVNNNSNVTSFTVESEFSLSNPTWTGYEFAGWTYTGQTTPTKTVYVTIDMNGYTFTANWYSNYRIVGSMNSWNYNNGFKSNLINPSNTTIKYVHSLSAGSEFKLSNNTGDNGYVGLTQAAKNSNNLTGTIGQNVVVIYTGNYTITTNASGQITNATVANKTHYVVYLNAWDWDNDSNAKMYVYTTGNTGWIQMTYVSTDIYKAVIAIGQSTIIFVRIDGNSNDSNMWNRKWNQTADLSMSNNYGKTYTITGWNNGTDGKSGGSWG